MYVTAKKYWPILLLIDLFGYLIFFWKKFSREPKDPKKVLFIRLEHIGDMVMSTPVFESWKKSHPNCEVHVLCKTLTKPIIENNPYVDKIITYDPSWMNRRAEDKKKSIKEVVAELRKERYDMIFEMHGDPHNNLLASRISGCTNHTHTYTIGYGCRGLGFLLNKTIKYDTSLHNILQNLEMIKPYCKNKDIVNTTQIYTDEKAVKNCRRIMKKHSLKKKGFIIINPKSGRSDKDPTYDEVLKFIADHSRLNSKKSVNKIILTGSKSEHQSNELFVPKKKNSNNSNNNSINVINIAGETDLLTLTELVKNSRLVIAPDTGIIHIAKAVNTEFIGIYKTTDSKRWGY
jgi:heptosyltransferase III